MAAVAPWLRGAWALEGGPIGGVTEGDDRPRFRGEGRLLSWDAGADVALQTRIDGLNAMVDAQNASSSGRLAAAERRVRCLEMEWVIEASAALREGRRDRDELLATAWGAMLDARSAAQSGDSGWPPAGGAAARVEGILRSVGALVASSTRSHELRRRRKALQKVLRERRERLPALGRVLGGRLGDDNRVLLARPKAGTAAGMLNALGRMEPARAGWEEYHFARVCLRKVGKYTAEEAGQGPCVFC